MSNTLWLIFLLTGLSLFCLLSAVKVKVFKVGLSNTPYKPQWLARTLMTLLGLGMLFAALGLAWKTY
jgi:hypothetical protein